MRSLAVSETPLVMGLLAVMVFLIIFTQVSVRPRLLLYPLVRQMAVVKLDYEAKMTEQYETEHFIIKYRDADADQVPMVAEAAEAAYQPVSELLGYGRTSKSVIYIYPDRSQMRQAMGWSGDESAMGVYYGGVIQVLAPNAWLKPGETTEFFMHNGPVAHEFTHLLLDYQTNGNYTRWYTEGLAQYAEYKVNGYEWITPNNHLNGPLYSLAEMEKDFDGLPNQALAYREALAAVRYIAAVYGEDRLQEIDRLLSQGQSLPKAISRATGLSYDEYEAAWKRWAVQYMEE